MDLSLIPARLSICQLPPSSPVPGWATQAGGFTSISRTGDELSIVCEQSLVPPDVKHVGSWRALQVDGTLDFGLTGILASLAVPLAGAGVSIFAVSTFNTDYVLVPEEKLSTALQALRAAGHSVRGT